MNSDREAWGTSWEKENRERDASKRVEAESALAGRLKRQAEAVSSLKELHSLIPDGVGVPLTPSKFIELFKTLPPFLRSKVLPDQELVEYHWSGRWIRTSVWERDGGLAVYLIDSRNQVLRDLIIDRGLLESTTRFGGAIPGRLEDFTDFTGRIYPGDKFLSVFLKMTSAERQSFFADSDILLSIPKPLIQVGLAPPVEENSSGQIAFESTGEDGAYVRIFPLTAAGVNRLLWLLTWTDSDTLFQSHPSPAGSSSAGSREKGGRAP